MGCQNIQQSDIANVEEVAARKAAKRAARLAAEAAAEGADVEQTEEEQKAARKAAKQAARLAAAEAAELEQTEEEQKAARKAAKKAARLAAEAAEAAEVEQTDEEEKAARKAAKKAAKSAAAAADDSDLADNTAKVQSIKRKAAEQDAGDSDSTAASSADRKRRRDADGNGIATKLLGAVAYRAAHTIVADSGCPDPMETFDVAAPSLGPALTKALLAQKYIAPTPIQAQGWPVALQGRDMVAVAKTGSGKTVGFLLPALARIAERGPQPRRSGFDRSAATPSVLVLAPTRELVQQIAVEADKFACAAGARVVVLYGGSPKGDQVRELKQGADIVIATPGRLLDLAAGAPERGLQPAVTMGNVSYLVLDEADRMLDMGFEPDIRKISEQCKPSGSPEEGGGASGPLAASKRQTLFFTATWPKAVERTARSLTSRDAVGISIGQGAGGDKLTANPLVKQTVLMLSFHEKTAKMHEIIKTELGPGQTCIVFAAQKNTCDALVSEIRYNRDYGFAPWCKVIHSGREQWEREETLKEFRSMAGGTDDKRAILVATDVCARGLDIPGVAMVIVHDFGKSKNGDGTSVESYVHRIGRTGRAGKSGKAWAFFTDEDSGACELVEVLDGAGQEVPPGLRSLANAEWYKNMEKENRKNWYRRGSAGSKGKGKGKGGGKGSGGRGGGKGRGW